MQKTIVITGVAGFIGSHLADRCLSDGWHVIGVDNLSMGSRENLYLAERNRHFQFLKADVSSSRMEAMVRKNVSKKDMKTISTVVHLAAKKIPRYGGRVQTLLVNSNGTQHMLDLSKQLGARFLFASTSDVYGMNPDVPFSERSFSVLGPSTVSRWAYASSKLFDEHLVFGYHEEHKLPVVVIRYFGSYGPRHHRSWWGGPHSVFIDAAISGKPIPVHGDGKQTRSFCYIDDTVEATFRLLTESKINGEILNIGNDEEISIIDLAKKILARVGSSKSRITFIPYDQFTGKEYQDVRRRIPDISKAKRLLRWKPRVSFKEGLVRTIQWHREHPLP